MSTALVLKTRDIRSYTDIFKWDVRRKCHNLYVGDIIEVSIPMCQYRGKALLTQFDQALRSSIYINPLQDSRERICIFLDEIIGIYIKR